MPVNMTKGLNTNALLFSENWESNNFSQWDYASPNAGVTIVTSPAQGSYSLKMKNGTFDTSSPKGGSEIPNVSEVYKSTTTWGHKIRAISIKFRMAALGTDDPTALFFRDAAGNTVVNINPAREGDPTRRMLINVANYYTVLNIGEWYTLNITNIDVPNKTLDFVCYDGIGSVESSDTDVPINPAVTGDIDGFLFINQLSESTGECNWDDLEIRGYGV